MQYRRDRYGRELSVLGFGCMRFTRKGSAIDQEKAEREIMEAFRAGVNYYDTAYIYPGSEALLGAVLERNRIRDQVYIATKLPQYLVRSLSGAENYFQEELERLRTDHVDYYLMHMLTDLAQWERLKQLGIMEWIQEKKATGAIRNIGFSFHGNTENFLKILDDYDWDFCQIQYNYLDETTQAGVRGLKAAAAKGIPVIIMEPLRGGKLVNLLPADARKAIADNERHWTPAAASIRAGEKVGCTACRYCMPCPQGVDIPGIFRCYNAMYSEGKKDGRFQFAQTVGMTRQPAFATQCIGCGKCEKHCPQSIPIREKLREADRALRPLPYKIGINVARAFMLRKSRKRKDQNN